MQKKNITKIKFVICGTGENLEYLREKTKNLKNFFLPGWVYKDEIASLLVLSSIGIAPYMPISSYLKTISNKAAEYLSGELPIALSLDKGTLYDLLRKNNAGIFYSGSSKKLAEKLHYLLENKENLKKMQIAAHHTFQKYLDGEKLYGNLIDYLEHIASK